MMSDVDRRRHDENSDLDVFEERTTSDSRSAIRESEQSNLDQVHDLSGLGFDPPEDDLTMAMDDSEPPVEEPPEGEEEELQAIVADDSSDPPPEIPPLEEEELQMLEFDLGLDEEDDLDDADMDGGI